MGESLITALCIEVACDIHQLAKTGEMPYSEILIPSADFSREGLPRSSNNQSLLKQMIVDNDYNVMNTDKNNSSGKNDIWGRVPPKEPKSNSYCPVCNRSVSVSSFARHLDKCMGIGSSRSGVGNSVTRSSATK